MGLIDLLRPQADPKISDLGLAFVFVSLSPTAFHSFLDALSTFGTKIALPFSWFSGRGGGGLSGLGTSPLSGRDRAGTVERCNSLSRLLQPADLRINGGENLCYIHISSFQLFGWEISLRDPVGFTLSFVGS
jgi:hypothetical protein